MAFDGLFGPPVFEYSPSFVRIRSLVLDHDTLRDVYRIVKDELGEATFFVMSPNQDAPDTQELFEFERLESASNLELGRLMLRVPSGGGGLTIDFRRGTEPIVGSNDPSDVNLVAKLVEHLNSDGTPRLRWDLIYRLPASLPIALAATWFWFLVQEKPPLSLSISGSLLVGTAMLGLAGVGSRLRNHLGGRMFTGHRIRRISRQQLWSERADRWANLKLAAVTIPAGAAIGALATAIAGGLFK